MKTFSERLMMSMGDVKAYSLSKKTGISESLLSKYLVGHTQPRAENAKKLSKALGINLDWLMTGEGTMRSAEQPEEHPVETQDKTSDFVTAPFYDIEASCGHGAWNDSENILHYLAFRRDWLRQEGLEAAHLAAIRARGDSMEPTIHSGDTLLVDLRITTPRTDGIYIIEQDGSLAAKRLQRAPDGTLYIRSDNPAYREFVVTQDMPIKIIGRLVWFGRRMA